MKTEPHKAHIIRSDAEVMSLLKKNRQSENETVNSVLRRVLGLEPDYFKPYTHRNRFGSAWDRIP